MIKRVVLLLFILTTVVLNAQTYKLGFNTEFGMYNNVKPSESFGGPYELPHK